MLPLAEAVRFMNQAEVYLLEVGKHQGRMDLLYSPSQGTKNFAGIIRVLGRI
jgi:hypothetical protein